MLSEADREIGTKCNVFPISQTDCSAKTMSLSFAKNVTLLLQLSVLGVEESSWLLKF